MMKQYKHENKGNGIITVIDNDGSSNIFHPGTIIKLNEVYTKFEIYGIFAIEQKELKEEKPSRITKKEMESE